MVSKPLEPQRSVKLFNLQNLGKIEEVQHKVLQKKSLPVTVSPRRIIAFYGAIGYLTIIILISRLKARSGSMRLKARIPFVLTP